MSLNINICSGEQKMHCTPLCKFTTKKSNALTILQKNDAVLNGNNTLRLIIGTIRAKNQNFVMLVYRFFISILGFIDVSILMKSWRSVGDITSGMALFSTFRSVKVMAMRWVIEGAGALSMELVGAMLAIFEMGYLPDLSAQRTISVSPFI